MIKYITSSCPNCKTIIRKTTEGRYDYGSPLRTCNNCGYNYIDNYYIEIAIDGIEKVDKKKIMPISIIGTIFGLFFMAGYFGLDFNDGNEYLFLGVGLFFIIIGLFLVMSDIIGFNKKIKYLDEEKEASEKRMKNPDYVEILKKVGYKIPNKISGEE